MQGQITSEGQIIYLGRTRAVISTVYSETKVEVVYLSQSGKYVGEDAIYDGKKWDFASESVDATYAERSPRLNRFISILKGR